MAWQEYGGLSQCDRMALIQTMQRAEPMAWLSCCGFSRQADQSA